MQRIAVSILLFTAVSGSLALCEEPVHFADANLKAAVEEELGVLDPTPIDMADLDSLWAEGKNVSDLSGLEHATNLSWLQLNANRITNVSPLAGLLNLQYLWLADNHIEDISPLAGLKNLRGLELYENEIQDITPLAGLKNLRGLTLWDNPLTDASPLSGLTNLELLSLSENQVADISVLAHLTNLWLLSLAGSQIEDITLLAGFKNLRWLALWDTQIADISVLSGLVNLETLFLQNNQISDISGVSELTKLQKLDLRGNPLNSEAYSIYIPRILQNNPGIELLYDPPVTHRPDPPILISPGSDAEPGLEIDTLTPTFHWQAVAGADYYALGISEYPYGSGNIVYNPQQLYGTSHTVPRGVLQHRKTYRWNMQAHNIAGWSDVSKTLYFQTYKIVLTSKIGLVETVPANIGEFGLVNQYVDPLYWIDTPTFSSKLSATFGNNLETSQGWMQVMDQATYDGRDALKGQWSRQGAWLIGADLRLFGDSVRMYPWHMRSLETVSRGSLNVQGLENSGLVPLHIKLDYDNQIDGDALEDSAMVMLNWSADWAARAATSILAPGVEGLNTFAKEVAKSTIKDKILEALDTGVEWFPEESRFKATTEALLELNQDVYFGLKPPAPIFDGIAYQLQGGCGFETTGSFQRWKQHRSAEWTLDFSPQQPLLLTLRLTTQACILGGAQAHAGIRGYRLCFDLPGVDCPPLVIDHRDPFPDAREVSAGFYKSLLLATVNTPGLVSGSVVVSDNFGTLTPTIGDKVVVLNNSVPSGFLMPLTMGSTITHLTIRAASLVSEPTLADKAALQIVFLHEDKFHNVLECRLDDMFRFTQDSGIPEMPYSSILADSVIDVATLPRGGGVLLIAFGNLETSDLHASVVINRISLFSQHIRGDLNLDNHVDLNDFAALVSHWLAADCDFPDWCEGTDLNYDGRLDFADFALFAWDRLEGAAP